MIYDKILKSITEEIEKTHDGTSLGKVSVNMGIWAEAMCNEVQPTEYGGMRPTACFDEKGKLLTENWHNSERTNPGRFGRAIDDLTDEQKKKGEIHYMDCEGVKNPQVDGLPVPAFFDFSSITRKNEDGEFYVRSQSLVGKDGGYVTLVRNDKFSDEDIPAYKEATNMMGDEGLKWRKKYEKGIEREKNRAMDWEVKGNYEKAKEIRDNAHSKVIGKIGTWKEHMDKTGVTSKLEEANLKLRTRYNNDNDPEKVEQQRKESNRRGMELQLPFK